MSTARVVRLVMWWVGIYTRGLPGPVARRRAEEIAADLFDHVAHARAAGTGDGGIARAVLSRAVRGVGSDCAWRRRQARAGRRRPVARVAAAAALLLSVPLVATLTTDVVAWGVADFVAAAVLLVGAGLVIDRLRRPTGLTHRAAVGLTIASALLLIWVVASVGLVAGTGDGADLMYLGVVVVGAVGAVRARFRPAGMVRVLLVVSLMQALATGVALAAGRHDDPATSLGELLALNAVFIALFAAAALLFHRAARAAVRGVARQ